MEPHRLFKQMQYLHKYGKERRKAPVREALYQMSQPPAHQRLPSPLVLLFLASKKEEMNRTSAHYSPPIPCSWKRRGEWRCGRVRWMEADAGCPLSSCFSWPPGWSRPVQYRILKLGLASGSTRDSILLLYPLEFLNFYPHATAAIQTSGLNRR